MPAKDLCMTMEIETFDSLWAYCIANERLVPMPSEWTELHGLLADTPQKPSGGMESSLAADSGSMGLHDPQPRSNFGSSDFRTRCEQ
jgi:hypothetical protein